MAEKLQIGPGFRGSKHTEAELTIYAHGDDPVLRPKRTGRLTVRGTRKDGPEPGLINVTTQKDLGAPTGMWHATIRMPHNPEWDLSDVTDNDWADITFRKNGKPYHVMRGVIDTIRETTMVGEDGTEVPGYVITGRDHARPFLGQIYFNRFTGENVLGSAALRAYAATGEFGNGTPRAVVETFLFNFLAEVDGFGRDLWMLPPDLPGRSDQLNRFRKAIAFYEDEFAGFPDRVAIGTNFLDGVEGGTFWQLAQQWCDPEFNELFADLLDANGQPPAPGQTLDPEESKMGVVLRMRPFPTAAVTGDFTTSPWAQLTPAEIAIQDIRQQNVARSGQQRINLFQVSPKILQQLTGQSVEVQVPLWDPASIAKHGVLRYEVQSNYQSKDASLTRVEVQREILRDWYCLNAYFRSGTIVLGTGRPDIRIGQRLNVYSAPKTYRSYYVEGVSHRWQFGPGIETILTVTRGWDGDDRDLYGAVQRASSYYQLAPRAPAGLTAGQPYGEVGTYLA